MLPSWPDLVGVTILVALVVVLANAAFDRWVRSPSTDEATWRDVLAPVTGLLVLAVPYLPWLPDAVPALRALAGPGRFAILAIVAGQMLWLAWDAHRAVAPRRVAGWWRSLLVFACSLAVYAGAASRLVDTPLYPGGDEPHYLVITQSLLRDGDLAIENNHARGDYREYFGRPLKPDYIARGRAGVIYSIHPVGLSVLVAPAFAIAGYHGAAATMVLLAALAATLMWRWAAVLSGSDAAATVAWLAAACSATYVLHSFAMYPEIPAALAIMFVVAGSSGAATSRRPFVLAYGLAIAVLPWLGTKYALVALVLLATTLFRVRRSPRSVAALVVPCLVAWIGWLYFFYAFWGSPLPSVPYGTAHHMSLRTLLVGAPGLFLDQEYGILPYAPALALAVPGLWRLWRDGGERRRLALEIALVIGALVATVGAFHIWWGGSAPPGREVVAGLLLLGAPIARWASHVAARPARAAAVRLLTLVGLTATAAMVIAREGLLIANGRDGTSELLVWLEPGHELARIAPSFITARDHAWPAIVTTACWIAVALGAAWALRRMPRVSDGGAAARVLVTGLVAVAAGAVLIPGLAGGDLPPRLAPALRAESGMLDRYDARRRPLGIKYTPFEIIPTRAVPPLFAFEATPGARRSPQPMRVLLNMRLSLPPGMYEAAVQPASGAALRGTIGLHIGRLGPPLHQWTTDLPPGAVWRQAFELPVDASFVGLRTTPEFEKTVSQVTITPVSIVNASDRPDLPVVLSAMQYGETIVTFHDETVYPEPTGFWVRGRSTLHTTFALPANAGGRPGVRLTLHGGDLEGAVRFETPAWRTRVALRPGERSEVTIPALPDQQLLPVRIVTETGFVPAEHGSSADRRLLGCWIEVLP